MKEKARLKEVNNGVLLETGKGCVTVGCLSVTISVTI
jgi:hypothetical protein